MRACLLAVALGLSFTLATHEVEAAAPKHAARPPHFKKYDFNQDGRINTMERANGRLMKAQQREWKAIRRNDAMVR